MAANGAVALEEGTDLKEYLTPLRDLRDQLLTKETHLEAEAKGVKGERLRVEKILKDAGLMERDQRQAKKPSSTAMAIAPKGDLPQTQRGMDTLEAVEKVVKAMNGEPFQIRMVSEETGLTRNAVETAIGYMRGQNKLRLLGQHRQIGRTAPGGRPAATFQEV